MQLLLFTDATFDEESPPLRDAVDSRDDETPLCHSCCRYGCTGCRRKPPPTRHVKIKRVAIAGTEQPGSTP